MADAVLADYAEVFEWLIQQSQLNPLQAERVALHHAEGRILAADVYSTMALPSQRLSAMDGYALVACDEVSDQAWLEVVGCQMAGQPPNTPLANHQALRVMTGACLPLGVNRVIPLEYTQIEYRNDQAWLRYPNTYLSEPLGKSHIKEVGCELAQGELVLRAGERLAAIEMALLASLGIGFIEVWVKPKVVVLLSGDELVSLSDASAHGEDFLPAGQIYEASSWWLRSLLSEFSLELVAMQQVSDAPGVMATALDFWREQVDLILTLGGASVGDKDGVTHALSGLASTVTVKRWQLRMRPAKPLSYAYWSSAPRKAKNGQMARISACHLLALPGNPVAGFMSFKLFARAFLWQLCGRTHWQAHSQMVQVAQAYAGNSPLTLWLQAKLTPSGLLVLPPSSSHLNTLRHADGYIALLPKQSLAVGEWVKMWTYA